MAGTFSAGPRSKKAIWSLPGSQRCRPGCGPGSARKSAVTIPVRTTANDNDTERKEAMEEVGAGTSCTRFRPCFDPPLEGVPEMMTRLHAKFNAKILPVVTRWARINFRDDDLVAECIGLAWK